MYAVQNSRIDSERHSLSDVITGAITNQLPCSVGYVFYEYAA